MHTQAQRCIAASVVLMTLAGWNCTAGGMPQEADDAPAARRQAVREIELPKDGGGTIRLRVKETILVNEYLPGKIRFAEPSPDNRHVVYMVKRSETQLVPVLDGVEGRPIKGILEGRPTFGADSRCVAYLVRRGEERVAIVDGEERKEHKVLEDDARIAAKVGGPFFRVYDYGDYWLIRRESKPSGRFVSPDGKRKAEVVGRKVGRDLMRCIAVDGVEGKPYKWVFSPCCGSYFCFSPNSKRTAYMAQRDEESGWVAVVDGAELPMPGSFLRCKNMITFDGPSSLHALASTEGQFSLVEIEILDP